MTENLTPCPFCMYPGIRPEKRARIGWYCVCESCLAQGPTSATKEGAVLGWNRIDADKLNTAPQPNLRVPDGWKLVPVEPTDDMLELPQTFHAGANRFQRRAIYKAMLEISPDPAPQPNVVLAPKHNGLRVDYTGLLKSARQGLRREPGTAEMLNQLEEHLSELGRRWYDGDATVVDEFLQLYCIQRVRRDVLAAGTPEGSTDANS